MGENDDYDPPQPLLLLLLPLLLLVSPLLLLLLLLSLLLMLTFILKLMRKTGLRIDITL